MSGTFVIDASVAGKLLFEEPGTAAAEAVFRVAGARFIAPSLLPVELASIVWKRHRRGELDRVSALAVFEQIRSIPVELVEQEDLLAGAFEIAVETDRTVYDCLYLAAAIAEAGVLVTADDRLVNALKGGPLGGRIRSLGSFA